MTELADAVPATTEQQKEVPPRDDNTGRFAKPGPPKKLSVRESILAAVEDSKRKAEPAEPEKPADKPQPKPQKAAKEELPEAEEEAAEDRTSELPEADGGSVERSDPESTEDTGRQPQEKPQASKEPPPSSWTKEGRAIWDSLPPAAQREVMKREADTLRGVEKLKEQYRDVDEAVAPYKAMIHQMGRTPGAAIKGLFDWQMALAGPNKEQAFRQLAANLGVNLQTITGATEQPAAQEPGSEVPHDLKPVLDQYASRITDLDQKFNSWQQQQATQQQTAANQIVENWAKTKPHFETVRTLMGQFINADLALIQQGQLPVGGYIKNGNIDLDAAYEAATWAHPEVRESIKQEEQAKREQDRTQKAQTQVKAAKKASVSIRPAPPAAPQGLPTRKPGQVETVRDSIMRAMHEQGR